MKYFAEPSMAFKSHNVASCASLSIEFKINAKPFQTSSHPYDTTSKAWLTHLNSNKSGKKI